MEKYTRVATAAVLAPCFVLLVWFGSLTVFIVMIELAVAISFIEYSNMALKKDINVYRRRGLLAAMILPLAFIHSAPVVYIILVFIFASVMAAGVSSSGNGAERAVFTLFGIFYVGLAYSSTILIRSMPDGGKLFLLICFATWGADIGAYYVGRFMGKRKLAPHISPGKTVEGFVGGVISSMLFAALFWTLFFGSADGKTVIAAGLIGGLIGVLGDLSESMIKRYFGVKDSGTILPGHGGLLDRADALMFTAPFFYVFLAFKSGLF